MIINSTLTASSSGNFLTSTDGVNQSSSSAAVSSGNTYSATAAANTVTVPNSLQLTAAQSARQKIDADYAKAKAEGTRVVADIANGGRVLDLTSLSDDEVAAAALNRDGSFTSDEKLSAEAELASRMWKALAPFDTGNPDNTGVQAAIKSIYPTLSQDMRDALGWTPDMLSMGDKIIAATPSGKKTHSQSLLYLLEEGQKTSGALKIDVTKIQTNGQGSTINLTV